MPEGVDISVIKLEDCPAHVPLPKGAKGFKGYGPGDGIEVRKSFRLDLMGVGVAQKAQGVGRLSA